MISRYRGGPPTSRDSNLAVASSRFLNASTMCKANCSRAAGVSVGQHPFETSSAAWSSTSGFVRIGETIVDEDPRQRFECDIDKFSISTAWVHTRSRCEGPEASEFLRGRRASLFCMVRCARHAPLSHASPLPSSSPLPSPSPSSAPAQQYDATMGLFPKPFSYLRRCRRLAS